MTFYFFSLMGLTAFLCGLLADDPETILKIMLPCILATIGGVLVWKPWIKLGTGKKNK